MALLGCVCCSSSLVSLQFRSHPGHASQLLTLDASRLLRIGTPLHFQTLVVSLASPFMASQHGGEPQSFVGRFPKTTPKILRRPPRHSNSHFRNGLRVRNIIANTQKAFSQHRKSPAGSVSGPCQPQPSLVFSWLAETHMKPVWIRRSTPRAAGIKSC